MRRPSPEDVTGDADTDGAVRRRILAEIYCLGLVFRFHHRNNHLRKAVTFAFVFVWLGITAALTFEQVPSVQPPFYHAFTALVFLIVGRMWDIEVQSLADAAVQGSLQSSEQDDEGGSE